MQKLIRLLLFVPAFACPPLLADQKPDMKTITLAIQDEQGTPIEGVSVRPGGLRVKENPSTGYGWGKSPQSPALNEPETVKTNSQGKAVIQYPEKHGDGLTVAVVIAYIEHPSFCSQRTEVDIGNLQPIKLQKGMRVLIGAKPPGKNVSSTCVDYKASDYNSILDWRQIEQGTFAARLPKSDFAVRAVIFGEDGRIYFSNPEFISSEGTGEKRLTLDVFPGTTVAGELDPSVPRPVKNGRVIASVATPCRERTGLNRMIQSLIFFLADTPYAEEKELNCGWYVSVDIAEDGTFTLPSLPQGNLEVVALCDGYVSKNPAGQPNDINFRDAQTFPVKEKPPITVDMEATGVAEIIVSDPTGKPVPNAYVSSSPNQSFHDGNSLLGYRINSADYLRKQRDSSASEWILQNQFSATTDSAGKAVISNLPFGEQSFSVIHPDFEQPILWTDRYNAPRRKGNVKIKAGEISILPVKMEEKGTSSLADALKKFQDQRASPGK